MFLCKGFPKQISLPASVPRLLTSKHPVGHKHKWTEVVCDLGAINPDPEFSILV